MNFISFFVSITDPQPERNRIQTRCVNKINLRRIIVILRRLFVATCYPISTLLTRRKTLYVIYELKLNRFSAKFLPPLRGKAGIGGKNSEISPPPSSSHIEGEEKHRFPLFSHSNKLCSRKLK